MRNTLRIAVRKFGPFEEAIQREWQRFAADTGCPLQLEAEALDLHPLHEALFEKEGLRRGDWDVAFVVTDWIAEAEQTGALLDLAPFLQAAPPEDYPVGWAPSLLRFQQFGCRVLGLPYHDGPECLIYRTDLLGGHGQPPVPKTWEEFHTTARSLSQPRESRWGALFAAYPDGHNTVYDFCLQLWTRGGALFDFRERLQLDTPAAREALTFHRAMLHDSGTIHPRSREFDSVQSGLAFARGEAAMMVNWFGFAALAETLADSRVKGRVAVAPIPSAPGHETASLNVYWTLGIGAGSPHADIAYAFLKHCAGRQSDRALTLGGGIGCRVSTWCDPEVNRAIPFYHALETIHEHARELPRLPHFARLATTIDGMVMEAINTARPVSAICTEAQRKADAQSSATHVQTE